MQYTSVTQLSYHHVHGIRGRNEHGSSDGAEPVSKSKKRIKEVIKTWTAQKNHQQSHNYSPKTSKRNREVQINNSVGRWDTWLRTASLVVFPHWCVPNSGKDCQGSLCRAGNGGANWASLEYGRTNHNKSQIPIEYPFCQVRALQKKYVEKAEIFISRQFNVKLQNLNMIWPLEDKTQRMVKTAFIEKNVNKVG